MLSLKVFKMKVNHSAPGLNRVLSSNFWWLKSAKHVKFTEECVICTEKHVLVKENIYKWVKLFKEGLNNIQDEDRPGRSTKESTPEMLYLVNALILTDRRVRIEDISEQLGIFVGTVHKILLNNFAFACQLLLGSQTVDMKAQDLIL